MKREDHLKFCTVCQLKDFDARQGVICSLTGKQADFEGSCPTFKPTADADVHTTPYDYPSTAINVENRMASTGKRFANHIVDTIVVYFLVFISGVLMAIGTELTTPGYIDSVDENDPGFTALSYLLGFSVFFVYYALMESVFGVTVGKVITGTRVVDKHGRVPKTSTVMLRTLSRFVPFEAFSFLGSARGWHDSWTDTWVVDKN
jgi:uncharacterized RDD family membrane protein YckC